MAEMKKVTWPDLPAGAVGDDRDHHLRAALGLFITILDFVLQGMLIKGIPSLFAGR